MSKATDFTDQFLADLYCTPDSHYLQALAGRMTVSAAIDPEGAKRANAHLLEAWEALPPEYQAKYERPSWP